MITAYEALICCRQCVLLSWALLLLFTFSPSRALTQKDPFTGTNQFPQYRNLSGLAGGGYGVDEDGYPSLTGPTAFSTPVAHVLGHGRFWLAGAKTSFDSKPALINKATNGTGVLTFGFTLDRFNIALTDLFKSADLDQAYNAQIQYVFGRKARWAASFGVQDWNGNGGAAGTSIRGDRLTSRSIFGVVTYRADTGATPFYLSAGIGRHRFGRLFGSASYQFVKPVRLWLEDDGYGINVGLLFATRFRAGNKPVELSTSVGLLKGQYFVWTLGFGF